MKIRLRTNLASHRIDCEKNWTLEKLIEEIVKQLCIVSRTTVVLSHDLEGVNSLQPQGATLEMLGLTDGSLLFLVGKFEKKVVEKSSIDVEGQVVPSGTTLHRVDSEVTQLNEATVSSDAAVPPEVIAPPVPDSVGIILPPTAIEEESQAMDIEDVDRCFSGVYRESEDQGYYDYEDDIRAPDESQQMQLIGDDDFSNVLLAESQEDTLKLQKYERSLRDAGLKEYDVQQKVMKRKDELLAKRMQRDINMDGMTVDEMMNSLLAGRQRTRDSLNYRKRVGYTNKEWGSKYSVDGRVVPTSSSSSGSASAAFAAAAASSDKPSVLKLKSKPTDDTSGGSNAGGVATSSAIGSSSSSSNNASGSSSSSSVSSRKMRLAGLNALPQTSSSRPTSSNSSSGNAVDLTAIDDSAVSSGSSSLKPPGAASTSSVTPSDGPSLSLKGSGYKPISHFTGPSSSSNNNSGTKGGSSAKSSSGTGNSSSSKTKRDVDGEHHRNPKMPSSTTSTTSSTSVRTSVSRLDGGEEEDALNRAIAESIEESVSINRRDREDLLVMQQRQQKSSTSAASGAAARNAKSSTSHSALSNDRTTPITEASKSTQRKNTTKGRAPMKSDEQLAAELQAEEDSASQAAETQQHEVMYQRRDKDTQAELMMNAVNDGFDEDLLALVMSDSLKDLKEHQRTKPNRPRTSERRHVAPPPASHLYGGVYGGSGAVSTSNRRDESHVMYDEDDEALARALQESLNDVAY